MQTLQEERVDQWVIETTDECFFTVIGNYHLSDTYFGIIGYIPLEDVSINDDLIETKIINNRNYAKVSNLWHWRSHEVYFEALKKYSHYIIEHEFFGKVTAVHKNKILKIFQPKNIKITGDYVENACSLLGIPKNKTAQIGSILLTNTIGKDVDLAIIGRKNVNVAIENFKKLINNPKYQVIRYGRVHQKMFKINNKIIDLFPMYSPDDELPIIKFESYGGVENIKSTIINEYDSAFTPSIYILESGKLLISYQVGYKMLLKKGEKISLQAHNIKVLTKKGIQIAYLIRFGDPWEDPTLEKKYHRKWRISEL